MTPGGSPLQCPVHGAAFPDKTNMAFRALCFTIACGAAWLLSGCGQYGPLYLPGNVPASQRPPHSASHPAPAAPPSAASVAPAAS